METVVPPVFRYHPDPRATGAVRQADDECERCGQARGLIYAGPTYAVDEVEFICPWCIADGSAASEFEAEFTTVDGAPSDVPEDVLDEVLRRTPGFAGWQQERWLFHCSDAAEFLGRVGYEDVVDIESAIEALVLDGWPSDVLRHMRADGDLTGYLFRCRHCGTKLAYADAS
ncbi:CbrC family protein [Nocardioides albidus]|uniref:CbrC family protein n=1 Tax=Nocardioides albidus TaxID=1517589 RepID=A0A5C4VVD3_9ACTN|nr:CbrC family protein [Nocardioides albidus]TNM39777.1 CbrC family protein [Nocardioides albidus]